MVMGFCTADNVLLETPEDQQALQRKGAATVSTMLLLSSLLMATQAQQVLLVGNSYTFYNNLDTIVGTLLATQGDAVQAERLAAGGLRLQQHLERCQEDGSAWNAALV